MDLTFLDHCHPLDADDERDCFRAVEAGVLATAVLDGAHPRPGDATDDELRRIAEAGRAAHQRILQGNLRMVARIALDASRRTGVNLDDLFQDGALELARAVRRFDVERGNRFSTISHLAVTTAVKESALRRGGELDAPVWRIRQARRLERLRTELAVHHGHDITDAKLATASGHRTTWVQAASRGADAPTLLVDEGLECEHSRHALETCLPEAPDWITLLGPLDQQVLRLLYGLDDGHERTYRWCADYLGLSEASIRRVERRALVRAKELLGTPLAASRFALPDAA